MIAAERHAACIGHARGKGVAMSEQNLIDRITYLENKVTILARLAEISTALNSRVQLEPLLKQIMKTAVEITGSEAASVLLWNNNKQQLFFAASTTISRTDDPLLGMPVPMDSIAGTILRENRTLQVDDARSDPRHYNKVDEDIQFQTRSLLGVPMTYKDRVIGVLEAINKRNLPWTEDDKTYLNNLAAQAAVAIEGAQLVMELKRANEELSEVDKLKNDFIAIASHELRTPLGVIMGYASFLQEAEDTSTQEHASKVLDSALKLRKIIEDMVNLRYVKQKQSDLQREVMNVADLISSLQRDSLAIIDTQKHNLTFEPVPDAQVYIDHTRTLMALTNVLHNAMSFTPEGGSITISAHLINNPREVQIRVTDTGVGLEKHQFEKIFEEFYQIEDHMIRHHGGLGIGLSIARAIVNAHGGRIWAESPGLGQGSTFTIALPLRKN